MELPPPHNNAWIDLTDKVIIVTGGSVGIGSHIVGDLRKNGAKVVVFDRNIDRAEDESEHLLTIQGDVSNADDLERLVAQTMDVFGRIDGLVNNAGVTRVKLLVDYYHHDPAHEYSASDLDYVFNVNVKGVLLASQAVAKVMIEQRSGVIVNISSEAGMEGSKGQSVYSASKGAVNSFTLSWAKELGSFGVRVVAVAPGINEPTPMGGGTHMDELAYTRGCRKEDLNPDYAKVIPLGRQGKLDEVADLVTYLCSDHASYITGTIMNVTGGKSRG